MCFMQIESVLQTKNRSEPAKNRFSVALPWGILTPGGQAAQGVKINCYTGPNSVASSFRTLG